MNDPGKIDPLAIININIQRFAMSFVSAFSEACVFTSRYFCSHMYLNFIYFQEYQLVNFKPRIGNKTELHVKFIRFSVYRNDILKNALILFRLGSVFSMLMFSFSNEKAVLYNSMIHILCGVSSIILSIILIPCGVANR